MANLNSLSIEELKKIDERKGNKLKELQKINEDRIKNLKLSKGLKITRNPIDKYTSIDELLRENIIVQRELADITHKVLLAIYYKNGGEASVSPTGVDTTAILKKITSGEDYRTLNTIIHNHTGNKTVLEVEGSGIIDVIKLVSSTATVDNKDYSVRIWCDEAILYANTWAELEARTPNERGMVCFEDEDSNEYLLIFKTIAYSEKFIIEVYNSNATLSMVQVKYHEKV